MEERKRTIMESIIVVVLFFISLSYMVWYISSESGFKRSLKGPILAYAKLDKDHDGFTPAQGDCNDANPAMRPYLREKPDGLDNNCDGRIDEIEVNSNDKDYDGIPNDFRLVANPNQLDADNDGLGAVRDTDDNNNDIDNDGIIDSSDNCPTVANSNQLNTDGDELGDACDTDDDGDGVPDVSDPTPAKAD